MGDREQIDYFLIFMRRSIREMDIVVLSTVFSILVSMSLVIRNLNYVHVLILNLIHSIDTFMVVGDWRKSGTNMFFGLVYLTVACSFSLHLAIPCIICVVILWIVTCFLFGCPSLSWIFFPCLTMWGLECGYKCAPDTIVVISMVKTAFVYLKRARKSIKDCLLICSLIAMHISFAWENQFHYLLVAYWLSFVWMWIRSPLRRRRRH